MPEGTGRRRRQSGDPPETKRQNSGRTVRALARGACTDEKRTVRCGKTSLALNAAVTARAQQPCQRQERASYAADPCSPAPERPQRGSDACEFARKFLSPRARRKVGG